MNKLAKERKPGLRDPSTRMKERKKLCLVNNNSMIWLCTSYSHGNSCTALDRYSCPANINAFPF